jgi:hypothetical protein
VSAADELKAWARRGAFEAKTVIARYPALALPIAKRRHGEPVDDATEIVIEGFPRSGTSFAVAAFRRAQGRDVEIACHVHAPAQILEGARRKIPTVLIVREPEATCVSFAIRNPHLSMKQAIRGYLRFHEPLAAVRRRVVVATFDEVTKDLGSVIDLVNARYGTTYARYEHGEEADAAVFDEIDDDYKKRLSGESFDRAVARPSETRDAMKPKVAGAYRDEGVAALRHRAERIYARLIDARG